MKILVIQQKMIGDVLTSSILFEALRHRYNDAQLYYLINEHTYPVVKNNPFIDCFIFFTKDAETSKKELFKLVKTVRKHNYDIVIDVYSKISSNIITLFSGAKTKISYHKFYTSFLYNHNIKRKRTTDDLKDLAIENRLQLLKPLGIESLNIKPKIHLTNTEIEESKHFLQSRGLDLSTPIFMISVLGSSSNKTYPSPYMANVIDTIVEQTNGQVLFNYIPKQKQLALEIFNYCNKKTKPAIFFDVFGKSLREFLAISYHCKALIGNEGGAINMAKALNLNTFAIFSPWIDKATWSLFESKNNVSVHLKDFKPEIFTKPEKKYKKEADRLYKLFEPILFEEKLIEFLKQ
ncbi:glycosyltransferase [Seonamhaeicola sp. S2-3]|uniref:glycosyltransferase family 9 protein n=1 Tax=Seonamhaeicola sp. S2-3 TaxID=1936081 RepID=UPI000972C401|nr:glycosyltransferase family 9 protein [Seonamhaeicola sp. S2-3]APY11960.1 glycosyltransferase [Seonamhaeicola sp. S2-3]